MSGLLHAIFEKQLLLIILYLTASCRKFKLIKVCISKQKQYILIATLPDKGGLCQGNPEFSKTFLWNHVKFFLLSSRLTSSLARYTLLMLSLTDQKLIRNPHFNSFCRSRRNLQKKAVGFPSVFRFLSVVKLMYKTLGSFCRNIPIIGKFTFVDLPFLSHKLLKVSRDFILLSIRPKQKYPSKNPFLSLYWVNSDVCISL